MLLIFMSRMGADGPKGWTSSLRNIEPCGFFVSRSSTSTGFIAMASSRVFSIVGPASLKFCTWTRCFPRMSMERKATISSIVLPNHCSGRSYMVVSSCTGGTSGPA